METAPFTFGIKATLVSEDDGDLILEGYASDFDTDRDAESFEPEAFNRGLAEYMANPVILEHHQPGKQLGVCESATLDAKGLKIRARIAKPPAGSWAEHTYELIRRGMTKGFSVGGAFKRRTVDGLNRIFEVDLQEISVTPLPVNPRTLGQVARKAFESEEERQLDLISAAVDRLKAAYDALA